jgi:hypothetical protein
MDSSQDPLVEEARSLIHSAKQSLKNGGSSTIVDPVTLAQGYLHLLIRQPTALYETKFARGGCYASRGLDEIDIRVTYMTLLIRNHQIRSLACAIKTNLTVPKPPAHLQEGSNGPRIR